MVLPGVKLREAIPVRRHMHILLTLWCSAKGIYFQITPALLVTNHTAFPCFRKKQEYAQFQTLP